MSHPISVTDAGKRYIKYQDQAMIVTRALKFRRRTQKSFLWAVRHVDLHASAGECVGVIGRNGSGKSTFLQMLAGVTAPSEGEVAVRGRIAPLIAVGVGFHPELTGRENVYVNGTILGLTRREIDARFDEIVDFSGIEKFIDTPVKFYSSGMYVRLGFSVAVQATPDILLVDEVLAVGDVAFQWKCFERMMAARESGTTIAVVSHNLNAVRMLCDRTVVLHDGTVRFDGDTSEAISLYHELVGEARDIDDLDSKEGYRRGIARLRDFQLLDSDGRRTAHVDAGDEVTFRVEADFAADAEQPILGFALVNERNINVYSDSRFVRDPGRFGPGDALTAEIRVRLPLSTGSYEALVSLYSADRTTIFDRTAPTTFYVSGRGTVHGVTDLEADFGFRRSSDDRDHVGEATTP